MIQAIYWTLAILVMVVLLISAVCGLVIRIKERDEFKELNQKHLEYMDTQIKKLNEIEKGDK